MRGSSYSIAAGFAALFAVCIIAYSPALEGGFVWDDDKYVSENPALRSLHGLGRVWFEFDATPQYYPLVFTVFWVEYQLWGLNPLGYHIVNVALHALCATLLWRVLGRLTVPGAGFAAAVFALHPVHVESVAWITECKNVLSGAFYLAAALAYLRFCGIGTANDDGAGDRSDGMHVEENDGCKGAGATENARAKVGATPSYGLYFLSIVLFACALLSKTVTCSLPAVLLLVLWWKRDRLVWVDGLRLLPMFAMGLAMGGLTAWVETSLVGARRVDWSVDVLDRWLVAGRAFWFYLGKLVWPDPLIFIYPRWSIDSSAFWQYVYPIAAISSLVALWIARRRTGRAVPVALFFFAGTLLPALGFFKVYFMRFSYVADHFQYLASIGPIALFCGLLAKAVERLAAYNADRSSVLGRTIDDAMHQRANPVNEDSTEVATPRGLKPAAQKKVPTPADTRSVPKSAEGKPVLTFAARGAVGRSQGRIASTGRLPIAVGLLLLAILGLRTWAQSTAYITAEVLWLDTLSKNPTAWIAHNNLGMIRKSRGEVAAAAAGFAEAIRLNPRCDDAHVNLGVIHAEHGRFDAASACFREALRHRPDSFEAYRNLGSVMLMQGRFEDAERAYRKALSIRPYDADAHTELGSVLYQTGRAAAAADEWLTALRIDPDHVAARRWLDELRSSQGGG
ncbi:MAG: tetratricopeptide repeat protein [Planctomycetes bacterium]|nr:tetratricopeptide repeat protein [Planctomycetota bacterium]